MGLAPARRPQRHVLVVDDHLLMREAVAALVREVEPAARVSLAGSLAQALAQAEHDPPDLALLDLELPDGRGETLLAALQRRRPGLPVLVLSADDDQPDSALLAGLAGLGAHGYCSKSAGHAALAAALRRVLAGERSFAQPPRGAGGLSARQLEVLGLLCNGVSSKDIGSRLGLDAASTRDHIDAVFRTLRVHNRTQAAAAARAAGLVG